MASIRPEIVPAAAAELESASRWYREQSVAAEDSFLDAFVAASGRLGTFPGAGAPYLFGTRSLMVGRFPYRIVYKAEEETVIIYALAHTSRRPGYWRDRLSSK